ncbi:ABC-2 transporter permease [Streptomyces microflavus]|uniref:hypothetical protein n=1 Tax=Streptomyces microflavus TaxID=1919 RepID=UPI0036593F58
MVTGECSSGTIRTTFAAVPHRGTVFAAKATLVAAVMYVLTLLSCSTAYVVGDATLPEGRYAQGDPLPALFGIAASFAVAAVLGLAVGTLVRHSAGAVTTVIGLLLLPSLFGPLFGNAERWIAGLSPAAAPGEAHPDLGRRRRHRGQPGSLALPAPGRGRHGRRLPRRTAAQATGCVRGRGRSPVPAAQSAMPTP